MDGHLVSRKDPRGDYPTGLTGQDVSGDERGKNRSQFMDSVLPIGTALGGGMDQATGTYSKPLLARVWFNPGGASGGDNASACGTTPLRIVLNWTSDPRGGRDASWSTLPERSLRPTMNNAEAARHSLHASLATGWSTWVHNDILSLVSLPTGATLSTMLCRRSTDQCLTKSQIDSRQALDAFNITPATRVGPRSFDSSYAQSYQSWETAGGLNASVEWSATGASRNVLNGAITPVGCSLPSIDCNDFVLVLRARYAWHRAGSIAVVNSTYLSFAPWGADTITISIDGGTAQAVPPVLAKGCALCASNGTQTCLAFNLGGGPILFSSGSIVVGSALPVLAKAKRALQSKHASYGNRALAAQAVEAAVSWNLKYSPTEVGPFLPVSNAWDGGHGCGHDDFFDGAVFGWDLVSASYLAALGSKQVAYSSLITVVKTKTGNGFVPNMGGATEKSEDRTEPNFGAKVLLDMHHRWPEDTWLIELLFDDLLDTNNWAMRERTRGPLGLVVLGTSAHYNTTDQQQMRAAMQNARFESGQDDSPMYDTCWDNASHCKGGTSLLDPHVRDGLVGDYMQMELYDVGMSSLVASEAASLAVLASVIGRDQEAMMLNRRAGHLRSLIGQHLWDEELGIYANKFSRNGSFYRRISPTSFFPLLANAATDEQAQTIVNNWLHSPGRFCIAYDGDFANNSDNCYWGLPSIVASDPAYDWTKSGPWRGNVWGPLALLTYWSLQEYDHLPTVRAGRQAMVRQLSAMAANVWLRHRHICERFSPHRNVSDCTGGKFYHWGALPFLVDLIEHGHMNNTGW
eukprot:SAG31_NODE_30_length_32545_cov_9.378999_30_plen_802_part_00